MAIICYVVYLFVERRCDAVSAAAARSDAARPEHR